MTSQASWSSSDPNLASVTAGLVSVLKLGEASITATYQGATVSINVVGRRRTGLRGSVTIEDAAGIRSIDGLRVLVDGRYVMSRSSSGRQPSMTISFSTADVATALPPGEHTLRLEIDRSGASSRYASAPSSEVVVVDLDTRQDLETLPLSRQDVTLETDGFIEWTVTIPIVSS